MVCENIERKLIHMGWLGGNSFHRLRQLGGSMDTHNCDLVSLFCFYGRRQWERQLVSLTSAMLPGGRTRTLSKGWCPFKGLICNYKNRQQKGKNEEKKSIPLPDHSYNTTPMYVRGKYVAERDITPRYTTFQPHPQPYPWPLPQSLAPEFVRQGSAYQSPDLVSY